MRISSQNNQFIFNFPQNFITDALEKQFQVLMNKNFIPYLTVMDYINSTIKDIVFPSISFDSVEQRQIYGKKFNWREAGNVMDKYQGELDISFRSVDSHLNYFMIEQCLINFYLQKENFLDILSIQVLDKYGDVIYTILLKDVIFKSLSELRMSYNASIVEEQLFTVQIQYNYIYPLWSLTGTSEGKLIFDIDEKQPDPYNVLPIEKAYKDRLNNDPNLKNIPD
jgi:hypothetical protein